METLIMNDDSCVDRASLGENIFGSFSHHDTNPFDKAQKSTLLPPKEGPGTDGIDQHASIKSQSLFSNHARHLLAGDHARTENGSQNFLEPIPVHRRNSIAPSELSMNTQENCQAMEQ